MGCAHLSALLPARAGGTRCFPAPPWDRRCALSGVVGIPMIPQSSTVVINAILAPVLIMGFLTFHPLGVMGAGLASTIAAVLGLVALSAMFNCVQKYMRLHSSLSSAMGGVEAHHGHRSSGDRREFALIFITTAVVGWSIRRFGPCGPGWLWHRRADDAGDLFCSLWHRPSPPARLRGRISAPAMPSGCAIPFVMPRNHGGAGIMLTLTLRFLPDQPGIYWCSLSAAIRR